jgi:hypothetical protein
VVASDTFGDAYVVPLHAAFKDMEKRLHTFVTLPNLKLEHATWEAYSKARRLGAEPARAAKAATRTLFPAPPEPTDGIDDGFARHDPVNSTNYFMTRDTSPQLTRDSESSSARRQEASPRH